MIHGDNQQQIPSDAEIAWLAGVIECDGSAMLSCYMRDERSKPKIGTELKLYNTDGGIIKKAVDILTRLGLSHYISERSQKPIELRNGKSYGNDKTMMSVTVKNMKDALCLSKLIRPYMYGEKGHRVDLIIQYLANRIKKIETNGGNQRETVIDKEDCSLVVDFYKRFVTRPGHNRHLIEAMLND